MTLLVPRWGVSMDSTEAASPTWVDVAAGIERLDGHDFNDLYLWLNDEVAEGPYMGVAGGPDLFVVYFGTEREGFHEAIDSSAPDGELLLVTGGQEGLFQRRCVIDRASALRAAHTFFETGGADPSIEWRVTEGSGP